MTKATTTTTKTTRADDDARDRKRRKAVERQRRYRSAMKTTDGRKPTAGTTPPVTIDLENDVLLTTAQAARVSGRSAKWLREARCNRVGPPCLKLGQSAQARVLYRRSDLERWISENVHVVVGG